MEERTLSKLLVSKEEADNRLKAQIEAGQQLHDRRINSEDELDIAIMEANNWSDYNTDLLESLFDSSAIKNRYMRFNYHRLSEDQIDVYRLAGYYIDEVKEYRESLAHSINNLAGICQRLELYGELSDISQQDATNKEVGDEVFIVHGRDDEAKLMVARFVEKLGIEAIILHEKPSSGRTIIEKIEKHAEKAGFAIVLITPDDLGGLKDSLDVEPNPRARQNVVFELGYFMGKLGRERVCPLFKGEVEKPSDIDGIVYVPMDSSDGWKLNLAQEMKQAGLPVDLNKLLKRDSHLVPA